MRVYLFEIRNSNFWTEENYLIKILVLYLINGSIKIPVLKQAMMKGGRFFTKQGDTWSWQTPDNINVGNYFLDKDANEVEITSKTEVAQEDTFYSLDVEDIDTYFTSDILVHNIPPGKCFKK